MTSLSGAQMSGSMPKGAQPPRIEAHACRVVLRPLPGPPPPPSPERQV